MIIKKFTAKDSRNAMAQIRNEFGPDAILLSSKAVDDHFEMVAAPNYDDRDIERELEQQRAEERAKAARQELERLEAQRYRERERQQQRQKERELEMARLHAQDQHRLKVLQDEMAEMRRMIEAQLRQDAKAALPVQQQTSAELEKPDAQLKIDQYLADIGLSRKLRESLRRRLQGINKIETASSKTMEILANAVKEMDVGLFPDRGIAAFVGAQGSGKTTALIKLAQKHRKRHGLDGIGLILFGHKAMPNLNDNLLVKYSESLGITCLYAETPRHLVSAAKSLSSKNLVLIDCAGADEPGSDLVKALTVLGKKYSKLSTFLTLAADQNRQQQEHLISAYGPIASGLIVSKVQNARHLGALVELIIRKKMPLGYISETRKTDANISQGDSEKLIRMALSLGKLPEESAAQQMPRRSVQSRAVEPGFMGIAS